MGMGKKGGERSGDGEGRGMGGKGRGHASRRCPFTMEGSRKPSRATPSKLHPGLCTPRPCPAAASWLRLGCPCPRKVHRVL